MASIVRICFAFILIAPAALTVSGCNDNSSTANTQTSPSESPATSGALAISGQPATTAVANTEYTFRPAASGAAGETLSFSVQNAPAWTTFDPATGTLSGTPSSADVGTYPHVSIRVGDGTASAELAAFAITVTAEGMQPVTISWVVPTTNTNGTRSTNLAGYHIYYGASAETLDRVVTVYSADVTAHVFKNLASGTWYFAVTAFNEEKVESELSAVAKLTL
jgi:hypothetical protein